MTNNIQKSDSTKYTAYDKPLLILPSEEKTTSTNRISSYYYSTSYHNTSKVMRACLITEPKIKQLLLNLSKNFSPAGKTYYPNMPFWRLKRDGFWQLNNAEDCTVPERESKEPTSNWLIECNVQSGFNAKAYKLVINKPKQIDKLAQHILSELLPEGEQDRLAKQLHFDLAEINRDPKFRQTVLRAYNVKQDYIPVGLELPMLNGNSLLVPVRLITVCALFYSSFSV